MTGRLVRDLIFVRRLQVAPSRSAVCKESEKFLKAPHLDLLSDRRFSYNLSEVRAISDRDVNSIGLACVRTVKLGADIVSQQPVGLADIALDVVVHIYVLRRPFKVGNLHRNFYLYRAWLKGAS